MATATTPGIQRRFLLPESELPKDYYNIAADLPEPLPPPLHPATQVSWKLLGEGLRRALRERHRTTDATAWGGVVGLLWMAGYFATLLPLWANQIVAVFSR